MSNINNIKSAQSSTEQYCFDNECNSDCNFSKNDNDPYGISVLPGSNRFVEYPKKNSCLNDDCCDDAPNFLRSIRINDLCPKAYPPTSICIRDSNDFSSIAQVNFINGDLIICDKMTECPNDNLQGLAVANNDLLNILPNLLGINGSIYIIGTQYRRITGFDKLRFVTGSIVIVNNIHLVTIPSFPNLLNVGGQIIFNPISSSDPDCHNSSKCGRSAIIIANNASLKRIAGFEEIRQVNDGIFIIDNVSLTHICGFMHLYRTNRIVIRRNAQLIKIIGFHFIDTINIGLFILSNNTDNKRELIIDAFGKLKSAGNIIISDNEGLKTIKFDELKIVCKNFAICLNNSLQEISSSVQYVNNLYIEHNKKLTYIKFDCLQEINYTLNINSNCSLLCINTFNELKNVGSGIVISDNKQLTEINGFNCLKYIGSKCICNSSCQINDCGCTIDDNNDFDWNTLTCTDDCTIVDNFPIDMFDETKLCNWHISENFFRFVCNGAKSCCAITTSECIPSCLSYSLIIFHNQKLKAIGGFCELKHVNSNIYIVDNAILHTINAFGQLAFALDIWIRNNPQVKYIIGFSNLLSIRDLVISESSGLSDFNSIKSLEFAQKIAIESKNFKTVKFSKHPIPSVLGYVLYYCYNN